MLEVYIRRFYRTHEIGAITYSQAGRFVVATVDSGNDGDAVRVVAGFLPLDQLPEWSTSVAPLLAELGIEDEVVIDVVTWREGDRPAIEQMSEEVSDLLSACDFGRAVKRVDVTINSAAGPVEDRFRAQNVTFLGLADGTFDEQPLYRNLHPMLGERLEVWRLSNFVLERRPSPEDVYLFDGVARSNPKDHRLFALAEVRELTQVHRAARSASSPRCAIPRPARRPTRGSNAPGCWRWLRCVPSWRVTPCAIGRWRTAW